jgi:hypothetical protein
MAKQDDFIDFWKYMARMGKSKNLKELDKRYATIKNKYKSLEL